MCICLCVLHMDMVYVGCACNVHVDDMYACGVWCVGRHMSVLVLHVYICVYDIVCVGGR